MLVFLYAMGLGLCAIAAYFGADTWRFVDKASHADGTVVSLKKGTFSQTWPIVAFETASGARIRFQGNKPSRPSPRFPIGTRLDILYDEREPSNARINTFIDMWGLTLVFGVIGLVFLALGTAVLFLGPGRSRLNGTQ